MNYNLIIIVLVLFATIAYSQEQPTATLKIGTIYDPQPGTVEVPVTLEAIDNPISGNNLISSFGWYIAYDTDVLYAGQPNTQPTLVNWYWGANQGNFLTNIIADNPAPGWNTIAIICSPWFGEGFPGIKFFDIVFTYDPDVTVKPNVFWTSTSAKGNNFLKFETNMADDEGNEFYLTLIDGYVGPFITKVPELKTETTKIWFENGNISFNAESPGEFNMFNLIGQQVMSAPVHPGLNIIPVKEKNTYYIIRVVTNSNTLTQKIFIQ